MFSFVTTFSHIQPSCHLPVSLTLHLTLAYMRVCRVLPPGQMHQMPGECGCLFLLCFGFQSSLNITTLRLWICWKHLTNTWLQIDIRCQSVNSSVQSRTFPHILHTKTANIQARLSAQEKRDGTNTEYDSTDREVIRVCVQERQNPKKPFSILNSCAISNSADPH